MEAAGMNGEAVGAVDAGERWLGLGKMSGVGDRARRLRGMPGGTRSQQGVRRTDRGVGVETEKLGMEQRHREDWERKRRCRGRDGKAGEWREVQEVLRRQGRESQGLEESRVRVLEVAER